MKSGIRSFAGLRGGVVVALLWLWVLPLAAAPSRLWPGMKVVAEESAGSGRVTFGPASDKGFAYLIGNLHLEHRDGVGSFSNLDLLAGYDFLIWEAFPLYLGPRLGLYSETVCTAYMKSYLDTYWKPSIGLQAYTTFPAALIPQWTGVAGVATDMLINLDSLHSGDERLYSFWSVFMGLRFPLAQQLRGEFRIEAGVFPFFDGVPTFFKFGFLIGLGR